jgi:hypothetical protein
VEVGEKASTNREHIEGLVEKAIEAGKSREAAKWEGKLEGPEMPEEVAYLWDYLLELDRARRYGFNGPEGLTYVDLDAWCRLTDRVLEPHEVEALMMLDMALRAPPTEEEITEFLEG